MKWVLVANVMLGCLVSAGGAWMLSITMKPLTAKVTKWGKIRFPSKNRYYSNLEVLWTINASPGQIIMVNILKMDLQNSSGCTADSVQIFDDKDYKNVTRRLDNLCGAMLGSYNTSGTSALIRFISNNDDIVGKGFELKYRAVDNVRSTTPSTSPTSSTLRTNHLISTTTSPFVNDLTTATTAVARTTDIQTSSTPITAPEFTTFIRPESNETIDDEDNIESSVFIGSALKFSVPQCFHDYPNRHILVATTGVQTFESAGYPFEYQSNWREEWLIVKPNNSKSLAIVVEDTDLEYSRDCGYDRVSIYDRSCPDISPSVVFCGSSRPRVTLTGDTFALVRFFADATNHGRGIKVNYFLGKTSGTDVNDKFDGSNPLFITIGATLAVGGFCLLLGIIRCIMRCCKRRKMKAIASRRQCPHTTTTRDQPSRSPRGRRSRRMTPDSNQTVTVSSISHNGRPHRHSRGGRNQLDHGFTGTIIQPPAYNALFVTNTNDPELILKPPSYDDKSFEPPPYPGSPTPVDVPRQIPAVNSTRSSRHHQRTSTTIPTRITVKPQDVREDIRSPPPSYEE